VVEAPKDGRFDDAAVRVRGPRLRGSGHLSAQDEELLAKQRVLGHELGARPKSITAHTDELPQCVAPEQRGQGEERRVHGLGQPLGARTTGHP
jgi:hypothetical protein